jgi:diguanylate cyclase (GGDEF)-like protein
MAVLYAATGVSFGLCAAVLIAEGAYVIGQAPRTWAEDLSLIVSIAGIRGVGALSLSLSQTRLARRHRHDAMTDAQTGLRNRRALFDAYRADRVAAETAIVVFDLDDFKDINDRFGHAVGDEVIIRFSDVLMHVARDTDIAARIGGEEFCLVINRTTAAVAGLVAERIREAFAREAVVVDGATLRCTVSAGVAYVARGGESLDSVMRRADEALYAAKRAGRNRVSFPRMAFAAA